jgi:uncharacterized OsmC-like protein
MNTANVKYMGDLRTVAEHLQSGTTILTDAPKDNHGKGEAFSPTDLVATAAVACAISIMGIVAKNKNIHMGEVMGSVKKEMVANPRRIGKLIIEIAFEGVAISAEDRATLEHAANTCPVFLSLHPDVEKEISFVYHS